MRAIAGSKVHRSGPWAGGNGTGSDLTSQIHDFLAAGRS
jgi:hypothetical protein